MKLIKGNEGVPYEGKGHFNCWNARKLVSETDSRRLTVCTTHFLPNGGADMSSAPKERLYFCLSGSLLLKGPKRDEYRLEPGDMVYIAPGEERSVVVIGTEPATILVFIVDVD
jgi:quercetin dioxygenase-like cupin family protein